MLDKSANHKPHRGGKPHGKVAFIRRPTQERLKRLHEVLNRALPIPMGEVTTGRLKALQFDANERMDPMSFRQRYLDACVLKRWVGSSDITAEDRRMAALQDLYDSEVGCKYTNTLFSRIPNLEDGDCIVPQHVMKVFKRARQILHSILGEFPWEEFPLCVDFTPGATTEMPRKAAHRSNKWVSTHITASALPYGMAYRHWCYGDRLQLSSGTHGMHPAWRSPEFSVIGHNTVFTVPKRIDTDRAACKPATWNGALQKGVGTLIRQRLQRCKAKLLLPDAQDVHGLLAKLGSVTGHLNTGDLVGASNSVTVGHIHAFFPSSWTRVMNDLRERFGYNEEDSSLILWEKMSTMGNGYTFEMETALFYALCQAACGNSNAVSVFGDDLIYPAFHHDKVVEAFIWAGFTFNRSKTYHGASPFRESCGRYYYKGVDVKPFYLQRVPSSIGDIIKLHNDVMSWLAGQHGTDVSAWQSVIDECRDVVPKSFWGPPGMAGCLWADVDECRLTRHAGWQAYQVNCVINAVKHETLGDHVGRLLSQLGVQGDSVRNRLDGYYPRGVSLTGYPLLQYLNSNLSKPGFRSDPEGEERAIRATVDKQMWTRGYSTDLLHENRLRLVYV